MRARGWVLLMAVSLGCRAGELDPGVLSVDLSAMTPQARSVIEEQQRRVTTQRDGSNGAELAAAVGRLGQLYHAHELLPSAVAAYREAERLHPADGRWPYLLGQALESQGERQDARHAYGRALERRPDDVPTLVALAEIELALGELGRADEHFRRLVAADGPPDAALLAPSGAAAAGLATAHFGLGRIAAARKRDAEAVDHFRRSLVLAPYANRVHFPLAGALRRLGRDDEARRQAQRAGDIPPKARDPLMDEVWGLSTGVRLHQRRAAMAFRQNLPAQAASELQSAVEAVPEDATLHLNLATSLATSGQLEAAIEEYEAALALARSSAVRLDAHYNLGLTLLRLGRAEPALEHLQRALEIEPGFEDGRLARADALAQAGQTDEARGEYEALLAESSPNARGYLGLAALAQAAGDFGEAVATLERGLSRGAGSPALLGALARLLATSPDPALRDGERAVTLARQAFEAEPSSRQLETLAVACATAGRFDEAARWQRDLIAAARRSGQSAALPALEAQLALYEDRAAVP